jgi:hypothetical protein
MGISSDLVGKAAGGRKLIAVVYADMVGYSRLIGLDDAGTLRRLRTLRRALIDPAIREHGGRVVQTGGDSLLVAFDSIDGAVRCAVKVQQQVPVYDGDQPPDRRIRFRIGINIGDVIPDVDEGAQTCRYLPVPRVIDEETFERWRPILEHSDQLPRAQERFGQGFGRVCDAQPVNRRASGQVGVVDHDAPAH